MIRTGPTLKAATFAAVIGGAMMVTIAPTATADAMSAYRWKNRPLLVFAPSNSAGALRRQSQLLNGKAAGLRDRDMVVVRVVGDRVSARGGRGPGLSAAALRKRYGVAPGGFRVILVGKDGGAKLSSGAPVSMGRVFRLIDGMPMRRQEMRRRGQ
ncbi:MAG: DUF4174 domain-containing protein [Pseudomonadota bacterium]